MFLLNSLSCTVVVTKRPHTLTGEFRAHRNFRSRFLAAERDVLVYLPPGYSADKRKHYPVLYLQDGQNLFDGATSYVPGMEWRVDETAQQLIKAKAIEPLIIVGIYNAGRERVDEYTPTRDVKHQVGGKANLYGRMIVEEIKPFIDAQYRTLEGPAHTGLGGSSLGGLVSLYLGLKYPLTFGRLAIVSPAVWWDNKVILRDVQRQTLKHPLRIWLDLGTREGPHATDDARLLRDALIDKGWVLNSDLMYFEAIGAEHNEHAWAQRVGPLLRYLFPIMNH